MLLSPSHLPLNLPILASAMHIPMPNLSPPYYLVAFTSKRPVGGGEDGYAQMAEHIHSLVQGQPGFLGINSVRGEDGHGITLSYWRTEDDIRQWKQHTEHQQAQLQGRAR